MMHDMMLRHMAARRNKIRPIYIVQEGDIERQEGGLYESTIETIVSQIDCVNLIGMGSTRLKKQEDGAIKYIGFEEFQLPYSELERIGIDVEDTKEELQRPGTYILFAGCVYRAVNVNMLDEEHSARVYTEKTMQPYPTLSSTFDFEDDTVGEDPDGWDTNEPTGTTIQVVAGKYLQMSNSGNTIRGKCYLESSTYSSVEASFDLRVTAATGSTIFFIKLMDTLQNDILSLRLTTGIELHLGGKIADWSLNEWVNIKIKFSDGYSIHVNNSLVKSGSTSGRFSYLMFQTSIASEATVQIDNVEVSAIAT